MALAFLATRCDIGDPPWVPFAQSVRDVGYDGPVFTRACRGANEHDLLVAFHDWLLDEVKLLAGSQPPVPPGDIIASFVFPQQVVDACGSWLVRRDYHDAFLATTASGAPTVDVDAYPLSVGCDASGGAVVLGYGTRGDGRVVFVGATGKQTREVDGPRPLSAISWNAARDEGWYWGLVSDAPALERVTRSDVREAPTSAGLPAGRIDFSRDGTRAVFAVQGVDNVTRSYETDPRDPLASPTLLVTGARVDFFDALDRLWMTRHSPTPGVDVLALWQNGTLGAPVLHVTGPHPWPGGAWAIVASANDASVDLVDVPPPETFLSQSGSS